MGPEDHALKQALRFRSYPYGLFSCTFKVSQKKVGFSIMASRKSHRLEKDITYDSISFFKLCTDQEFNKEINKLRKRYGINTYNLSESVIPNYEELENEDKIFEHLINDFNLQDEVSKILKKINLSEYWHGAVMNYLILDENLILGSKFKPDGIHIVYNLEKRKIIIEIGEDATLEEIKMAWPAIQKRLPKTRKKKWENFRRDLIIFKEYESGKNTKEIQGVLEKVFDKAPSVYTITNAIYRYKHRMK